MHPSSIFDWLAQHRPEAGLTLRMSAAGLIAFAAAHLIGLTQIYWAVLTAVIVTQASIGGSLKAMIDRFLGTIGGAGWGVAVTLAIPHHGVLATGFALAVALVPLAAVVAFRPSYRIAPVTAAIVLLAYPNQGGGVVEAALERVFEIGLGSVVALGVLLVVAPARAHELLCSAGQDALVQMAEQVKLLLGAATAPLDPAAVQELHDRIRAAVERAAAAAGEVDRERRSYITAAPDPDPLVRTLRRLSHDLIIIARALLPAPLTETAATRLAQPVATIAAALAAAFTQIGAALASRSDPPDLAAVAQALAGFEAELSALRRDGVTRALPEEAVERIFGLAFGFEQIGRNLAELAGRVRELVDRH
jgi:uncharacterized membrane protein YccC